MPVFAAELPTTPADLARSLLDAAAPLAQLCSAVTRFFANPDCLQAAFWPPQVRCSPNARQRVGGGYHYVTTGRRSDPNGCGPTLLAARLSVGPRAGVRRHGMGYERGLE